MSLMEALFLEPPLAPLTDGRPAHEVWIAARTDGVAGSGTQSDPFDGTAVPWTAVSISSLTRSGTTATAVTSGHHGFADGDLVSVSGVDIHLETSSDGYYVGTFAVEVEDTAPDRFTYTMLGTPHSSPATPLSLGSLQCWRERERFDAIMRQVPEQSVVHLGVGVFETKGAGNPSRAAGGWTAKSGQRIVGAGMALTTLKLVGASAPTTGGEQHAISCGTVSPDGFEVSDLTVDCNVEGQLNPYVSCGAITLPSGGRHVRIRRVRVINFGSRGPLGTLGPPDNAYRENFPIFIGVPMSDAPENLIAQRKDTHDCVIEDCLAERRSPNVVWNSTVLLISGGEYGVVPFYTRGCAIRNCLVNDEYVYGPVVAVESIAYNPGTNVATVTTKWPHGYTAPGNVVLRGAVLNGTLDNPFNGVFAIESIISDAVLTYKPFSGASGNPTGDIWIGGGVSSHAVAVRRTPPGIELVDLPTLLYKLTTHTPHNLTTNNCVRVSGVKVFIGDDSVMSAHYNGSFKVTEVVSPKELKFELLSVPETNPDGIDYLNPIHIHIPSQGITIAGGTGAVAEGNRVYHCGTAGPWHDTFSTLDSIARNNYYHDVKAGPFENLGGPPVLPPNPAPVPPYAGGTLSCVGLVATFDRGAPHGLSVGDSVHIRGAVPDEYNGIFAVKSVSSNTFTYDLAKDPGVSQASATPLSVRIWQTKRMIVENNVIELGFLAYPYLFGQPFGVWIAGTSVNPLYRHRAIVVRGNMIRHNDNVSDPSGAPFGIALGSIGRGIIESNIINLFSIYPAPIIFNHSAPLAFFNNQTVSGKLEQGFDNAKNERAPDLVRAIEDAVILSF